MKALSLSLSLLALATLCPSLSAQEAYTDPVGFVSVTVPAQSDAVLAVPLYRSAEYRGTIQSISGNIITLTGTPGWTVNQFVQALPGKTNTYAVLIASGTKEGMFGKLTANDTGTVTVQLDSGDDFTGVKTEAVNPGQADYVDIVPYWTPNSLVSSVPVGTEFLGFQGSSAGVNLAATQLLGYTGTGWEDEITSDDASHVPLNFGAGFVIRNNSASPLSVTMIGSVPMSSNRLKFRTLASGVDQDIRFGYLSPVPEAITSLGIPAVAGDAILGFNNAATGKNKSAATIYAFDGTQWVDDITGEPLDANAKLQPGYGYVFRKFRTASAQTTTWTHLQSYLQ